MQVDFVRVNITIIDNQDYHSEVYHIYYDLFEKWETYTLIYSCLSPSLCHETVYRNDIVKVKKLTTHDAVFFIALGEANKRHN